MNILVDYNTGLKMMYKLAKNAPNLCSDNELRGQGMRIKHKSKIISDSDSPDEDEKSQEKSVNKKQNFSYPVFPRKQNSKCNSY